MANHGHHTHALCLLTIMMSDGLHLLSSNQRLPSLRDPFLIWFVDQFDQRLSPDLTDSSTLQCRYFIVRSIQWNWDFLPRRRFVFGAFPCRRWFFRLPTGVCLLTQGYEVFTWVFDPDINRVLAADEDVIKLVEMKKNRGVHSGTANFKDATSEAIRDWVTNVETTHYILGFIAGPHPYPMMVRDFHAVIGKATRRQAMEKWGGKHDVLIACVGGVSTAMGLFHEFVDDTEIRMIGVEAAGFGLDNDKHSQAQRVTSGDPVTLFVFVEDENYDSDLSVSNRNTEKSRKLV